MVSPALSFWHSSLGFVSDRRDLGLLEHSLLGWSVTLFKSLEFKCFAWTENFLGRGFFVKFIVIVDDESVVLVVQETFLVTTICVRPRILVAGFGSV